MLIQAYIHLFTLIEVIFYYFLDVYFLKIESIQDAALWLNHTH